MPMNPNPHKGQLDHPQVFKAAYDCEHEALRILRATEEKHSLTIKAEDGDSIESVARAKVVQDSDGAVDCSRMRKLRVFGTATASVSADGEVWEDLPGAKEYDLCAMFVKVTGGKAVMRS